MPDRLKSWGVTLAAGLILLASAGAADLNLLKVLYVGEPGTARAREFEGFLKLNCGNVAVVSRRGFQRDQAKDFDVVLLDWPQSSRVNGAEPTRSPLGDREKWAKPTVLLGSAGLLTAEVWEVKGGFG